MSTAVLQAMAQAVTASTAANSMMKRQASS